MHTPTTRSFPAPGAPHTRSRTQQTPNSPTTRPQLQGAPRSTFIQTTNRHIATAHDRTQPHTHTRHARGRDINKQYNSHTAAPRAALHQTHTRAGRKHPHKPPPMATQDRTAARSHTHTHTHTPPPPPPPMHRSILSVVPRVSLPCSRC